MFGQALGSVGAAETLGNGSSDGGSGGGRHSRSSSGAATPTPGTSIASAFDLSDFPSLGSGSGGGGGGSGAADGHAAALRQQQHLAAHPHQHHQQFLQAGGGNKSSSLYRIATAGQGGMINLSAATASEDFPALPGSASLGLGGLLGSSSGGALRHQQLQQQQQRDDAPSNNPSSSTTTTPTVSRASSSGSGGLGLFGAEVDGMLGQKQLQLHHHHQRQQQQHQHRHQQQQKQQQHLEGILSMGGGSGSGNSNGASAALGSIGSAITIGSSSRSAAAAAAAAATASSSSISTSLRPAPTGSASHAAPGAIAGATATATAAGSAASNLGSASTSASGGTAAAAAAALNSDYGLLGLLSIIRMTDADRNALALGSDLTSLGMNLNSGDKLYSTFASPWSESPTTKEPQYQLPMCYYMQPPALKTGHLSKFQLETLFYIFYALPRDVLQAYAAQELYLREWRYHVDLRLWFKQAGPSDGLPATNGGSQYIYFDMNTWERRLFNGNAQGVTGGFLSEDDVRVKFPSS